MKKFLFILLLFLLPLPAYAADPLNVSIASCDAYQHTVKLNDWLFVCRTYLIPTSDDNYVDTFSVTIATGDFVDVVVLTNRIVNTTAVDFTVVETAGPTDITAFCTLQEDNQTINCTGTGL